MPNRIQNLRVADLRYDPENPRLPRSIDGRDESQVLEWMLDDATILNLVGSIGAQGYFPGEPLLVVPDGDVFTVVEGNRRLSALKLLIDPRDAPVRQISVQEYVDAAAHRPEEVSCVVFDSRSEINDYLGYRHVTGVKEWSPLAKARYLRHLAGSEEPSSEVLIQLTKRVGAGSRTDYVRRLLSTLKIYDYALARNFYDLSGVNEDSISFSVFSTALAYEKIRNFVLPEGNTDDENLRLLLEWMFQERPDGHTVLGESRRLSALANIVASPQGLEELKSTESLERAEVFTKGPVEAFRELAEGARLRLETAKSQTARVTDFDARDESLVLEILQLSRELRGIIQTHMDEDE